jgi:hypothetical protein
VETLHVRFGGRARETDPGQPGHRARARPNRSDTAAIMSDRGRALITAGQPRAEFWNPTGFGPRVDVPPRDREAR